jgi:hypothetical protein
MMITNQDRPLILWLAVAVGPACPAHIDFCEGFGLSEYISTGIHRISQDRQNHMIQRRLPIDLPILISIANCRQRDSFLAKPEQRLPCAPVLLKLLEHQPNRVLYPQVGIEFDGVA